MVKNKKILEEFEIEIIKKGALNIEENLKIFNELLSFAREMKKVPPSNFLEGIELDIKYAGVINGIKRAS